MIVNGNIEDNNVSEECLPLLQALLEGKTISSITYMHGSINKYNRALDITIENVKGEIYWVALGYSDDKPVDYVHYSNDKGFYMDWVISYKL